MDITNCNKIITTKGYAIRKSYLNETQIELIQKNCIVEPKTDDRFATKGELKFKIYLESPERYYLPREWAIQKFGKPDTDILSEGITLSDEIVDFKGNPYDYQTNIIETYLNADRNGLICVPCGKGKTFMALNIASRLKKRLIYKIIPIKN